MQIAVLGSDAPALCRKAALDVVCLESVSDAATRRWDLLALTQKAARRGLPAKALSAERLLLPEGVDLPIRAEQAVDYGLSSRNTLTLSSLTGATRLLCLQRSLRNLRGELLEPQELPLSREFAALDTWQALFLAGMLIYCRPAGSELELRSDRKEN